MSMYGMYLYLGQVSPIRLEHVRPSSKRTHICFNEHFVSFSWTFC